MPSLIDMGEIKPVDNGVNCMATTAHDDKELWIHFGPDMMTNELNIAVVGLFNGHQINRRFTFTEHEIVESCRTAIELVWERLNAAYPP